jgi:hypothetical protein
VLGYIYLVVFKFRCVKIELSSKFKFLYFLVLGIAQSYSFVSLSPPQCEEQPFEDRGVVTISIYIYVISVNRIPTVAEKTVNFCAENFHSKQS